MPNKPRLLWLGPSYLNGVRGWSAVLDGHSFMIAESEEHGGFTASAMKQANLDMTPRDFRPDPDRPGGVLGTLKPPEQLEPGNRHRPVMLGGGVDGGVFSTLEAAQEACERYARGIRRGLNS